MGEAGLNEDGATPIEDRPSMHRQSLRIEPRVIRTVDQILRPDHLPVHEQRREQEEHRHEELAETLQARDRAIDLTHSPTHRGAPLYARSARSLMRADPQQ